MYISIQFTQFTITYINILLLVNIEREFTQG